MMNRIREYINPKGLEFHYKNNKLNIINYDKIVYLENDKIILLKDDKTITIKGDNLSLLKLLENEILIDGVIKQIDL